MMPPIVPFAAAQIMSAPFPGAAVERPIVADVRRTADGVHLRLLGDSRRSVRLGYSLTTTANGVQSVRSEATLLQAGRIVVLLDQTDRNAPDWRAMLRVTIDDRPAYDIPLIAPRTP